MRPCNNMIEFKQIVGRGTVSRDRAVLIEKQIGCGLVGGAVTGRLHIPLAGSHGRPALLEGRFHLVIAQHRARATPEK